MELNLPMMSVNWFIGTYPLAVVLSLRAWSFTAQPAHRI